MTARARTRTDSLSPGAAAMGFGIPTAMVGEGETSVPESLGECQRDYVVS
jgi:hypothetical protein